MQEIDFSSIEFSNNDKRRGIKIPKKMTPTLAEIVGIVIGDGHVTCISRTRKEYKIEISGCKEDFEKHHKLFVIPKFKNLFNIEPYVKIQGRNEYNLSYSSKAVASLFCHCFNIPHNKKFLKTPYIISDGSLNIKKSYIRGLFDTDGHFCLKKRHKLINYYPVIGFTTTNQNIFEGVESILLELNINFASFEYNNYYKKRDIFYHGFKIEINGEKNTKKWLKTIGFNNQKNNDKIKKWARGESNSGNASDLTPSPDPHVSNLFHKRFKR